MTVIKYAKGGCMTTYEVCYDTWQAGKQYRKGDIVQLSKAPQGGWCIPVDKQPKEAKHFGKLKE